MNDKAKFETLCGCVREARRLAKELGATIHATLHSDASVRVVAEPIAALDLKDRFTADAGETQRFCRTGDIDDGLTVIVCERVESKPKPLNEALW